MYQNITTTDEQIMRINNELPTVTSRCLEISVVDDPSYRNATEALVSVKSLRKQIASVFDPAIKSANDAHKRVIALKKQAESGLIEAETYLKGQIATYQDVLESLNKAAADSVLTTGQSESLVLPPERQAPEDDNVSTRIIWKWRVTDMMAFVKAVANGDIPLEAVVPNEVFINNEVGRRRSALGYPGIEAFPKRSIAVSTKNV